MGFTKLEVISLSQGKSTQYPVISRPKPGYPDEIVPRLLGNFADSCFYFYSYFLFPFYGDDEMISCHYF
jgi:hypothetical protein